MAAMELYLFGSYVVTLVAIVGYQVYIQSRLKRLSAKVAVMKADSHGEVKR